MGLSKRLEDELVDIIHRIGMKAPLTKVYEALATIEGVAGWWTEETSGDSKPGGTVQVLFRSPEGTEVGRMAFEMVEPKPNQSLRWRFLSGPPEWLGTEVTFELTRDGDQTLLVFGHRNWREPVEFMAHCSMKWATFLLSLKQLTESGEGRPSPRDVKIDNWN